MAATELVKVETGFRGVAMTRAEMDKTLGNKFACNPGKTHLLVHNTGENSVTIAIPTSAVVAPIGSLNSPLTVEDLSIVVAAGVEKMIGPFTKEFMDATGFVNLTFTGTAIDEEVLLTVIDDPTV